MSEKIAVVLFNLGGPDCENAIRPFLMNFFMDKNIIPLPAFLRYFIASGIARKRTKNEAGESYHELGNKSPLLENSLEQAEALNEALGGAVKDKDFRTFVCMRYWHPMAPQVVREVRDWGADRIVLLPLYPQFSTTTTWSSLEQWDKAVYEAGMDQPTSVICCYPFEEGYITASTENIAKLYEKAAADGFESPRILFSAHGLPEKVIKGGDPYQWQCEKSAEHIAQRLGETLGQTLDWQICYQSKVGRMKWIGPSLDEALGQAAKKGKAVIIYPHAFTQEHVETLVELDIEYKEMAEELGIKGYYRAQTVSAHPAFIKGMTKSVLAHIETNGVHAQGMEKICPTDFGRCCMVYKSEKRGGA